MTRTKDLGDLGEGFIERLLKRAKFQNPRNLNRHRPNHPGGDFLAKRDGVEYFISVKTRNKYKRRNEYERAQRLNDRYNLYPEKVRKAARAYDDAVPSWVMIQIDTERKTFCAYFGRVDKLRNPKAIAVPMTAIAVADYECLANDEFCAEIAPELSNQLLGRPSNLSSPNLDPVGPESRLLKKGQFVRTKDKFSHALAMQSKKIRDARQRQRQRQQKFEEELYRELQTKRRPPIRMT